MKFAILWGRHLYALEKGKLDPIPPTASTPAEGVSASDIAERLVARIPRDDIGLYLYSDALEAKLRGNFLPRLTRGGTRKALQGHYREIARSTTGWACERSAGEDGRAATLIWLESGHFLAELNTRLSDLGRDLAGAWSLPSALAGIVRKRARADAAVLLLGQDGAVVTGLNQHGAVISPKRIAFTDEGPAAAFYEVDGTLTSMFKTQTRHLIHLTVFTTADEVHPERLWSDWSEAYKGAQVLSLAELAKHRPAGPQANLIGDFDRRTNMKPVLQVAAAMALLATGYSAYEGLGATRQLSGQLDRLTKQVSSEELAAAQRAELQSEIQRLQEAYGPGVAFSDDGRSAVVLAALAAPHPRVLPQGCIITGLSIADDKCVLRVSMPFIAPQLQRAAAKEVANNLARSVPSLVMLNTDGLTADSRGVFTLEGSFKF